MFYRVLIALIVFAFNTCWATEAQIASYQRRGFNRDQAKLFLYTGNHKKSYERMAKASALSPEEQKIYYKAKRHGRKYKDACGIPEAQGLYEELMTSYGLDEGVAQISLSYQSLKSFYDSTAPKVVAPDPLDLSSYVGKGVMQVIAVQDDLCVLKCMQSIPGSVLPPLNMLLPLDISHVHLNGTPLVRGDLNPDDHLVVRGYTPSKLVSAPLLDGELHIHP